MKQCNANHVRANKYTLLHYIRLFTGVQVFSDASVSFLNLKLVANIGLVANIKIRKSHYNFIEDESLFTQAQKIRTLYILMIISHYTCNAASRVQCERIIKIYKVLILPLISLAHRVIASRLCERSFIYFNTSFTLLRAV